MKRFNYLYEGQASEGEAQTAVRKVNGEVIVHTTNFDTKKALEYMKKNDHYNDQEGYHEILQNLELSYVEHPREDDGCPGRYTKLKGTYKGIPFEVEYDYEKNNEEDFHLIKTESEEVKKAIMTLLWGGEYTTFLFWS